MAFLSRAGVRFVKHRMRLAMDERGDIRGVLTLKLPGLFVGMLYCTNAAMFGTPFMPAPSL
jgi:hypothetical protein